MTTQIIDDQDSQVMYVGNWARGGLPNEYDGMMSSSTTVNDFFTVAFKGDPLSSV